MENAMSNSEAAAAAQRVSATPIAAGFDLKRIRCASEATVSAAIRNDKNFSDRLTQRASQRLESLTDGRLSLIKDTYRVEMLDLDNALEQLKRMHGRQWEVVTLRFFGGLKWSEIAAYLDVSTSTVEKDWQAARAWLYRTLKG